MVDCVSGIRTSGIVSVRALLVLAEDEVVVDDCVSGIRMSGALLVLVEDEVVVDNCRSGITTSGVVSVKALLVLGAPLIRLVEVV